MSVIDTFGRVTQSLAEKDGKKARKLLEAAYAGFGAYQKYFPDKRLTKCRHTAANASMAFFRAGFSAPEKMVLASIFTPTEFLQAFHLHPLCAEMVSTYLNGAGAEHGFIERCEQEGISSTFCSYHKTLLGAAFSGVLGRPKAIVNTSLACDANNLTFRTLARELDTPQYYIDVPNTPDEEAVKYTAAQIKEAEEGLIRMGCAFDVKAFHEAIARSRRTIELFQETMPYRAVRYVPNTLTAEMYEALLTHSALGTEGALQYAEEMKEDYRNAPIDRGIRIVWLHSNPFWQSAAKDLFNANAKVHIVATELSYDNWEVCEEKDPYLYMAKRVVYDLYNGPVKRRAEKALGMCRKLHADGAVLFCQWGCKETCGGAQIIRQTLEAAGIPVLVLNGDGVDRHNASAGQTSTRLEAFVEMLEERR